MEEAERVPIDTSSVQHLNRLLRRGAEWDNARHTIDWLVQHPTEGEAIEAIRVAWQPTSLALRGWAADIDRCEIWIQDRAVQLAVHLSAGRRTPVLQEAPLSRSQLDAAVESFPKPLPDVLIELALAAPGLTFIRSGSLAASCYLFNRLGAVGEWFRHASPDEVRRLGFQVLDPDVHLVEVGENGIGDMYVCGADGTVYFFDHEATGLVPCSISLRKFFESYLEEPDRILDPYAQAWATEPTGAPSQTHGLTPCMILFDKEMQLPRTAQCALAVRGCERALAKNRGVELPAGARIHERKLEDILELCRTAVISGMPLSVEARNRTLRELRRLKRPLGRACEATGLDFQFVSLLCNALPVLVQACAELESKTAAEEAVNCCDAVMIGQYDDQSRSTAAAIDDADYLAQLNLVAPGSAELVALKQFFERPLWKD